MSETSLPNAASNATSHRTAPGRPGAPASATAGGSGPASGAGASGARLTAAQRNAVAELLRV